MVAIMAIVVKKSMGVNAVEAIDAKFYTLVLLSIVGFVLVCFYWQYGGSF